MKLRLPKALIAVVTTPLALGMVMAPQAMAEYISSDGPITVDLLPALPSSTEALRELWISSKPSWTEYEDNGTGITEDQVASSLSGSYGLAEEGWHFSNNTTANGDWTSSNDITLLTKENTPNGFSIIGRNATAGEFAMATAGVSTLLAGGAQPSTLSLTFTTTTASTSNPTYVSVWKWDGNSATKLELVSVEKSTSGVTTTLGDLSISGLQETDKLVFIWFAKDGGTTHSITNISTTVDQAAVAETLTWIGATRDWSKSGVSNWQGESGATVAIGARDSVVFGDTEGEKAVNVTEDITVKGMSVSDAGYTFSGDGAITVTDALTVENTTATIGTDLTLGAATVTMTGADSALTVTGDVSLLGTVTNDGGHLAFQGGLGVVDNGALEISYSEGQNGYATKTLVKNTNGGTVKLAGNQTSINIGGTAYNLVSNNAGITAKGSSYLVNSGTVVYGGTGEEASEATTASDITLNGGRLELKTDLANGTAISMAVNSTVQIDADATLSAGEVQANGHTLTIDGTGTFATGATLGATLASTWTGTVEVSGLEGALHFTQYSKASAQNVGKSTVRINGASGWLKVGGDAEGKNTYANIEFAESENGAALTLSDTSTNIDYNFHGTVSGAGDLAINQKVNSNFIFKGDAADWTGSIIHADRGEASEAYTALLKFEKDGLKLGVEKISHTGGYGTLEVQITGSGDKVVSGSLENVKLTSSGTGNLKLETGSHVTSAEVTNGSLTVADKLTVDSSLSAKNAAGESGKGVTIITKPAARTFGLVPSGDGEGEPAEGGATVTPGATIQHATVSATGITKETGYVGYGSIDNATITIDGGTEANKFSITHMEFTNSIVDLADGAFVSMDDVVIGAGSAVVNGSGNTYTASNMKVVLTAADVAAGTVSFDQGDGTVTLTSNVLGTNANLSGTFDLTLADGFLKALQLEVLPDYSGTLIIDFGSTVSLADITPGTLDVTEYADDVTLSKVAANGDGAITGVIITFVDNDKAIPEPATATLSLLALAGLAARRRRKN